MGEESEVGGWVSLGELGLLALLEPNFLKSSEVALGWLCWGRVEIQQCCLSLALRSPGEGQREQAGEAGLPLLQSPGRGCWGLSPVVLLV